MSKSLFALPELCNGCRSCEIWCSFFNKNEFSSSHSLIRIFKDSEGALDIPILTCKGKCPHPCNEEGLPICVEMCPTGALIYVDAEEAYEKRLELCRKRELQPLFRLMAPWKWPYPWAEWRKGGQ